MLVLFPVSSVQPIVSCSKIVNGGIIRSAMEEKWKPCMFDALLQSRPLHGSVIMAG